MNASLRALLTGVIDYAGLFPPAGLPLDQAIRNYAKYQQEPESWMLARFICPAARLEELSQFLIADSPTLIISVLGRGANAFEDFMVAAGAEAEAVATLVRENGSRICVDAFETRLSEELARSLPSDAVGPTISGVSVVFDTALDELRSIGIKPPVIAPFYEAAPGAKCQEVIAGLTFDHEPTAPGAHEHFSPAGFKLRCGGLHASAFPTPEQVAFTIAACRDAKVPLKFTAGLHHPIRHFNSGVQTHMHGFINVFVGGVLADACGLTAEQLRPILEDENPKDFVFDDSGLRWKDYRATTEEIVTARQRAVTSFGSCSFDEPRDDLRALGWL